LERSIPDGRVALAGGEAQGSTIALSRVLTRIASVWSRTDR
jgi:hypothetical protein